MKFTATGSRGGSVTFSRQALSIGFARVHLHAFVVRHLREPVRTLTAETLCFFTALFSFLLFMFYVSPTDDSCAAAARGESLSVLPVRSLLPTGFSTFPKQKKTSLKKVTNKIIIEI